MCSTVVAVALFLLSMGAGAAPARLVCPAGTTYAEGWSGFERATWCARKDGTRHGPYRLWYDGAKLKEEGAWDDGEMTGRWTAWWPNGKKRSEGVYAKGLREGVWTSWYENGQLEQAADHRAGKPDGSWNTWYPNGKKAEDGSHKDGMRVGRWTWFYDNGNKQMEGSYRIIPKAGSVEDGRWTYWYANGRKKAEGSMLFGLRNGFWSELTEKGKETVVEYKFGMEKDDWESFQQKAKIEEEIRKAREGAYPR